MSRWVRIDCAILDHAMFKRSEFSEREAWIWMIVNAAWKDTRHRVGGEMMDVSRGSLFVTLRELQSAWGWASDKRVRGFLSLLESERMILKKSDAGKTQITICNYCKYQDVGRGEDASGTQAGRKQDALKIPIYQDTKDISSLCSDISPEAIKPEKASRKPAIARPENVPEGLWNDFVAHRKAKRAPITQTVLDGFAREARTAGITLQDAIRLSVERNWQGFKAEWLNDRKPQPAPQKTGSAGMIEALRRIHDETCATDDFSEPRGALGCLSDSR